MKIKIIDEIVHLVAESQSEALTLVSLAQGTAPKSEPREESKKHKKHVFKKTCPTCKKEFKGKAALNLHTTLKHGEGKAFSNKAAEPALADQAITALKRMLEYTSKKDLAEQIGYKFSAAVGLILKRGKVSAEAAEKIIALEKIKAAARVLEA